MSFVLIAGDFTPLGGMDRANHALASYLASRGDAVTLITHRAWPDLSSRARIVPVRRPLGSHLLGAPLLAAAGNRAATHASPGTRIIANGGNADTRDVAWVHYLHAARTSKGTGSWWRRQRVAQANAFYLARERAALPRARVVICNSRRTARDVQLAYNLPVDRLHVVYYGCDAAQFSSVTAEQRSLARRALGWDSRPVALFVGALADDRKGFDRLIEAWRLLSEDPRWDVALAVAGAGAAPECQAPNVRMLGFRQDISQVMAACDVLVHPARYEAYGLGVHEAICRGVPAIVAKDAGVAELYPEQLHDLLIDDVESAEEIASRVRHWHDTSAGVASRLETFATRLRARSWDAMSAELIKRVA